MPYQQGGTVPRDTANIPGLQPLPVLASAAEPERLAAGLPTAAWRENTTTPHNLVYLLISDFWPPVK